MVVVSFRAFASTELLGFRPQALSPLEEAAGSACAATVFVDLRAYHPGNRLFFKKNAGPFRLFVLYASGLAVGACRTPSIVNMNTVKCSKHFYYTINYDARQEKN